MKTILFIGQTQVQALQLHKKQKQYSAVELQSGAVLNGVILDSDKLRKALVELNIKTKKVTLIIDSSNILSKKLSLPNVSQSKLHQIVKGEFDLFHTEQNYQYDVNVMSTTPSLTAMGYAVGQDMMDAYLQVCKDCGLVVERVDFLLNGLINYISQRAEFQGKTFLFNVIFGEQLLSILFENGTYKLSNRLRLLHANQGELFYQELYSRMSAMSQFSSSERSAHAIADSYYIGISQEDVIQLSRYVEGILPISVQSYQDANWDMNYFLPALATYNRKRDINFAVNHHRHAEKTQKRRGLATKFIILAAILGMVGGHSWIIYKDYQAACLKHDQTKAVLSQADRTESLAQYSALQVEDAQLDREIAQYEALFFLLDSGAVVEKEVLEHVFQDEAISNFSFDFISGSVNIQGQFPTNAQATEYAAKLREQGFFVSMDYNGYNLADEGEPGRNPVRSYNFTISAAFAPIVDISTEEVTSK